MTIGTAGGTLHGQWTADNAITQTSDRRKKKNIVPLYREVAKLYARENTVDFSEAGREAAVLGVIKAMRPVSFRYSTKAESKYSSFGFIAQELEHVYISIGFFVR